MSDQQTQNQGPKRYNVEGTVRDIKVGTTKQKAETWMTFRLDRPNGKKTLVCKAFAEKADNLLQQVSEGSAIRLFGFYQQEKFTGQQDGAQVNFQSFKVLWSGAPKYIGADGQAQENEQKAA